jgi:hypothetical protein
MTRVVILPEDGQPDTLKALLADVAKSAGDETITTGHGGVVVSAAVAKRYLGRRSGGDVATSGHTVDNTRAPLVTKHVDASTGQEQHPDDSHAHGDGLSIGGRTPDGEFPGGYEGIRVDQRDPNAAATP